MKEHVVREFHRLFYERGLHANYGRGLHAETRYHGIEAHKCPLDLWIFQEILCDVRPQLVIELGTYLGGTTLFLAHQLDTLGGGQVVSVDCRELPRPHPLRPGPNDRARRCRDRDGPREKHVRHDVEQGGSLAESRTIRDAAFEHRPDDERLHGPAIVGRARGG